MRRFFSTTLGQILAIVACSSAATFLVFLITLFIPGSPPNPRWPWQATFRIAGVVEILQNTPQSRWGDVVQAAQRPGITLRLSHEASSCIHTTLNSRDIQAALQMELPTLSGLTARSCTEDDAIPDIQVLIPLRDQVLEIHTDQIGREPPRISYPLFGALLFMCVGVAALSAWAVSRVIRPLRRLSERADAFGRDIAATPLVEEGPLEIRRAAHAFNLMQERIAASIQARTQMLAAVSHDLRSPLTRMRLQLDVQNKEISREKLLKDVTLMQTMVTSALTFLSTNSSLEKKEWLDLGALLATLCDEYEDAGARIRYDGPDQIPLLCRPDGIERAMTNLIENAIRFGDLVAVIASVRGTHIMIDVTDDGPGIPEEKLQQVIEPFVRLDQARADRSGSVGLGLAIVNDVARAHGGRLTLLNRKPSGLTARVEFF